MRWNWSNVGGVKWIPGALAALISVSFMSCSKEPEKKHSRRYHLACGPSDQHALYLNPIDARQVVKIRYDSRFAPSEVAEIEAAMDAWNSYSLNQRGNRVIFEAEEAPEVSTSSIPANGQDCEFAASADGYGIVLVDDNSVWETLGLTSKNPAVTVRCSREREFVTKQVILVNVNLTRNVSASLFQTVLKHEMGHTLGLDHSCDMNENGPSNIGCSQVSPNEGKDYYEAVMYPEIRSGFSQLTSNDHERAGCILGESG